jgi:linearmycin/streptolysin S transport system permease protein
MKTILLIIKKDLNLFLAYRKGLILTFLVPILLISLFAFAFGGIGKSSDTVKEINLLYADNDNSLLSKKIIASLDSLNEIKMTSVSEKQGLDLLKKGKKVGLLLIGKGLQDSISQSKAMPVVLKYDASHPFEYGILKSIVTGKIIGAGIKAFLKNKVKTYLKTNYVDLSTVEKENIIHDVEKNADIESDTASFSLKTESVSSTKTDDKNLGLIQAVSGTAIMMLLFSIAGIGGGLLEEKESGTLTRLLYSPIKKTDILFGKMGAILIISVGQLFVMFTFSWLAFGLPIFKDPSSLVVLTLSVAFSVSSFGIFLVSIAKTRQQLQNLSTIIILLMSALGGSMIPLFVMPVIMQKMAVISLNYWGIQGYYDIFWRGLPFADILPRIAVLMGIGIVMSLISIPLFKRNIGSLIN